MENGKERRFVKSVNVFLQRCSVDGEEGAEEAEARKGRKDSRRPRRAIEIERSRRERERERERKEKVEPCIFLSLFVSVCVLEDTQRCEAISSIHLSSAPVRLL